MFAFILTVSISLAITGVCSILEAVLLSLSSTDIAKMTEKRPRIAATWKHFKANIHQPIAVILIVNTFAHTIGASLSGAQFNNLFGQKWVWVYSLCYSLVMIQWTEILPKSLAVTYNRRFAGWFAMPMRVLMKVFRPAVIVVDFLNKPFAPKGDKVAEADTLTDIAVLAHFAQLSNVISDRQEKIVERGLALSQIKVKDVMVGREDIKFLSTDMNLAEALIEAHIHHHTRFPLINGTNTDVILGYVNFKDIVSALQLNPKDPSLKGICRPVLSIDEDENLSTLLNRLIKSYQHIAVVRNANGVLKGVVTLEDVIESLVGEISDEYDLLPSYIYQIAENRYVVGGGVSMARVCSELCRAVSAEPGSLNDWMLEKLARSPRAEDMVTEEGVTFHVRKISRSQIYEAVVMVKEQ